MFPFVVFDNSKSNNIQNKLIKLIPNGDISKVFKLRFDIYSPFDQLTLFVSSRNCIKIFNFIV